MFNAGREAEVLDMFRVWAPGIIKKMINKSSFKVAFCSMPLVA